MRILNRSNAPLPVGGIIIAPGATETVSAADVAKAGAVVAAWLNARILVEVPEVVEPVAEPNLKAEPLPEEPVLVRKWFGSN